MAGSRYFLGLRGRRLLDAHLYTVILLAFTLFGYLQSVAGGLTSLTTFEKQFPLADTALTTNVTFHANIEGTTVAMYTLGCFFGALSCLFIADPLGRIRTVQLGGVVHVVGSVLQASSYEIGQLIAGRLVRFNAAASTSPMLILVDCGYWTRYDLGHRPQLAE